MVTFGARLVVLYVRSDRQHQVNGPQVHPPNIDPRPKKRRLKSVNLVLQVVSILSFLNVVIMFTPNEIDSLIGLVH